MHRLVMERMRSQPSKLPPGNYYYYDDYYYCFIVLTSSFNCHRLIKVTVNQFFQLFTILSVGGIRGV